MQTHDKGSAIIIEVEFKKQTPFGTAAYFDPTTPKITIKDSTGMAVITDANLTKSAVGKWYYICQTLSTWNAGAYTAVVTATDGTWNDITILKVFGLR